MMKLISTIVAMVLSIHCIGQTTLTDATGGHPIDELYHFRTSDARMDILAATHQPFEKMGRKSLGYNQDTHWFRFDLVNSSSASKWYLEVGFPPLDHVELYSHDSDGNWSLQYSGDLYKISSRIVRNRNVVFPITLPLSTRQTFYMKVVSTSALQVPLTVWSEEGFRDNLYREQFAFGVFYGIMLIMIFYNLFLYISIRDKTIIYYVFTLITGVNIIAYFHGYGFYFLNPEWPELNPVIAAFSSPLFVIASVSLTRSFLSLRQFSFWLDRAMMAVPIVAVIFAFLTLGLGDFFSFLSLRILGLINFLLIFFSTIYCVVRGNRPARFFLLAWSTVLILGVGLLFRNIGWIPGNWFFDNALYIGSVMQTLLISFALGDKFNNLKNENLRAKERELQREHEEKEKLEKEVAMRTEEIRQKNALLEESNRVKDKLFSLISHDLRGPLLALHGVLEMERIEMLTPEETKRYLDNISNRLNYTSDFLDNLLQWSKLQISGENFAPVVTRFAARKLLTSNAELLKTNAERKNIVISVDASSEPFVSADENMMQTVVRNLVSNAVKFTRPGGRIVLSARQTNNIVTIAVTDNGVGIAPENMARLFVLHGLTTPGTSSEKGTGIGLVVCKEFVERNGGRITVRSEPGLGTTFQFTLPAA